ncbi:MAG: prenyltransferase/squalene oxidase repeat-containing protein [Pseudomonas sp.]|uniref:prenyltransferase/squalene oxidase repeat-containing protein n=1 Tax=Pseudomonas TaxID=286 RepID=UPI0003C07929|nr:prenyltransferase/squalene oxidase repeat-containing protein [Pseudomonas sp. VLB120]AGZ35250.1 prenyltransferase/squalene oxidase [Pseudomonas sp. VLB120]
MIGPRFPEGHGLANGQPDLWCTYAAIRSLAWVERLDAVDSLALQRYIQSRRNRDGGFAWSKGMPSDAWATFYCTQTLQDLGIAVDRSEETAHWLHSLFDGEAYAMCPGQTADVWATHYALRTLIEVCAGKVAEVQALYTWLGGLQCANGGLSWSADFAQRNHADTRACFYGVMAARALASQGLPAPDWNIDKLIGWLQAQQTDSGGFRFSEAADVPCLWATYRATASLAVLQAEPLGRSECIAWIASLVGPTGAFVRWSGYDGEDVWAAFCAVGTLKALNEPLGHLADDVARFIASLAVPEGGYTYRRQDDAADVLTTAAAILGGALPPARQAEALRWIEGCQMPNEPGVMYMPGRGAEVRCSNWALAAGAFADLPASRGAIGQWLATLQNPDGGFGFWEGRGSDMVSTASAVAVLRQLNDDAGVDLAQLEAFVASCRKSGGHATYPRGQATLRASLQALGCLAFIGQDVRQAVMPLLEAHKVPQGGFANQGRRIPDLLSTYQAMALMSDLDITCDLAHLRFFLGKIRSEQGYAWSPLYLPGHDALSTCLGRLLEAFAEGKRQRLPNLYLS